MSDLTKCGQCGCWTTGAVICGNCGHVKKPPKKKEKEK